MVHPGVGEYNRDKDEIEYKAYYQWVPFVLFMQACIFYVPHALFKVFEGGKVAGIISGKVVNIRSDYGPNPLSKGL